MHNKDSRNQQPSEPVRIGGNIGLLGGIVGAAAAAIFLVSYVSIFHPFSMPLALAIGSYGQGFASIGLVITTFVVSAYIGWKSTRPRWASVISGLSQVALGVFLTTMSFLAGFTFGPFIMPGAFLVLLSGIVLTWSAFVEHVRH